MKLNLFRICGSLSAPLALVGLAGCSGVQNPPPAPEPATALVWPALPDQPRISYVRSICRPADFGIKVSTLGRIGQWLTGSDKGDEVLVKPFGIALDENDNLCLTDTGTATVSYYDRVRKKSQRWSKIGNVRFVAPVAIAKHNGVFYVADSGLGQVLSFNENGKLQQQITNHLERPVGLAVCKEQLYVADSQRHAVVIFDLAGSYRSEFGQRGEEPGEFNFPTHLTADSAGNLYVTDSMNGRVQVFDAAGKFQRQIGSLGDGPGSFSRPKGLALDSLGHLYVVDALFDNFQIFDDSGRLLLNLGEMGPDPGQFWLPNGITISRTNEILVADSYNRRVQVFKYIGQP
jgi:sugar lactone lactonase YvrE